MAVKSKRMPTMWDPSIFDMERIPEHLSELELDWVEELSFYIAQNRCRLSKNEIGDGYFEYEVHDEVGNHVVTVESSRDLLLTSRKKRRRKR